MPNTFGAMDRVPDELRDRVISLRRGRGWGPDRIYRELDDELSRYGVTASALGNWIYKRGGAAGDLGTPTADRLGRVAELLERSGIDPADIGKVQSLRLSEWQGLTKNDEGEAELHDLKGASIVLSPEWAEGPRWAPVDRGPAVKIPRPLIPTRRTDGLRQAVVIPDVQIGFRRDLDTGELVPFHDEAAMAAALRVVRVVDPDDLIVLGDFVDFPTFSRFEQEPGFALTTQPAVDRATLYLAELAAAAPRSTVRVFIEGNHDRRIQKTVTNNALSAFGLRPGFTPPDTWPDLSVPHLLRLDELGFAYLGGYPAGIHWVNENLACIHGHRVNSAGSTASRVVDDSRISVIFGHVHRIELQHRTRQVYEGERSSLAASPGCLARIDGTGPSTRGSIDCFGRAVATTENWQHGCAVITYEPGDGWFDVELIRILRGVVFFRGQLIEPPVVAA